MATRKMKDGSFECAGCDKKFKQSDNRDIYFSKNHEADHFFCTKKCILNYYDIRKSHTRHLSDLCRNAEHEDDEVFELPLCNPKKQSQEEM